jgi:hypothetical protein
MRTWMKWVAGFGAAVTLLVAAALLYGATGDAESVRELPMKGITSVSVGDADLVLVSDDQNKLVVRTTRRQMPWVMANVEGALLELGLPSDADPRSLLLLVGAKPYSDRPVFELHTRTVTKAQAAGNGAVATDGLKADSFELQTVGANACTLRGLDLGTLRLTLSSDGPAPITVAGTAKVLDVMNSSPANVDGTKLTVGTANVISGGTGSTTVILEGQGLKRYSGGS